MGKKVTIGGQRLGAGDKMQEYLHGYGSSVHNLSYAWKSSMTVGTLVPFMTELMTNGDHAEINLDMILRTHPTIGAMFGTYKLQVDVFKCPIRYYVKALHNNKKGVGMDMSKITFPILSIIGKRPDPTDGNINGQQIATNSLAHYLGISGLGRYVGTDTTMKTFARYFNGVPLLS